MILGCIIETAVGVLLIVLGSLIWFKRKVSLLHSYHYKNVKEEDLPTYCRLVGIALMLMGGGIVVTGVLNIFYLSLWWLPLVVGFTSGGALFVYAQKKYNGSIM